MTELKKDIKNYSRIDLRTWMEENNFKPFRADQIFKWIYLKQYDSFSDMTNVGKELRTKLESAFVIERLAKKKIEYSKDGTKKFLFGLKDGKFTETVLIPEKNHYTACISSQVGCAQQCTFCYTAKAGFIRNLTPGEIIGQVRDLVKYTDELGETDMRLTNLVLMGMGEPLANYKNVIKALEVICDSDFGLKFSLRKITLSTCGLIPKLIELGNDININLAISLNATDNKTRDLLMPVNKKYPIEKLIDACRDYPLQGTRKITFEYILMKGINDSDNDAKRLVKLMKGVKAKINLIPFNEYEKSDFKRPDEATVTHFLQVLHDHGFTAIIRKSKGQDISAACGQLHANEMGKE